MQSSSPARLGGLPMNFLAVALAMLVASQMAVAGQLTTSTDPSVAGQPITMTVTGICGPHTCPVSFYWGLSSTSTPNNLIETINGTASVSISWTPPTPNTYYLYAITNCCPNLPNFGPPTGTNIVTQLATAQVNINPNYEIVSLLYDPPGNQSSNGFVDTTMSGHVTTIGSSFQDMVSLTYTHSLPFSGGSVGATFGFSNTSFSSKATQHTYASANGSQVKSADNSVNHTQDYFFIWTNPQVTVVQTGPSSATYTVDPPIQSSSQPDPGLPEPMVIIPVSVQAMRSNPTTVPLGALLPQTRDDSNGKSVSGLPGLANICAQPKLPSQCTQANQCGCTPKDFANIVAEDVLLTIPNTKDPTTLDPKRFIPITSEVLEGPQCPASQTCGYSPTTYTVTDADSTVVTNGNTKGYTVGYTIQGGIPDVWSLRLQQSWTWSYTESQGKINGSSHQTLVTLGTSTHECFENVNIFEDTKYNTFLFQEPTTAGGC